jgi:hypothetical protein
MQLPVVINQILGELVMSLRIFNAAMSCKKTFNLIRVPLGLHSGANMNPAARTRTNAPFSPGQNSLGTKGGGWKPLFPLVPISQGWSETQDIRLPVIGFPEQ